MELDPRRRRIRDEIGHHIDELETELRAGGMSAEDARAEAARRFGDAGSVERATRGAIPTPAGGWSRVPDAVAQDVRYAVRQLVGRPLVSALTIATIVVGVAATVVVFSVVHAVVLRPLPFPEPDRVMQVNQTSPQGRDYSVSEPNFVDFRARQGSFVEMAAMGFATVTLEEGGEAVAVEGMRVSDTFFSLLGLSPTVGRAFLPEEDRFGAATQVAILSEAAWTRRFGGSEEILGRTILVDGRALEVVGIAPTDRAWPGVEIFTPLAPDPDQYRDDQRLMAVGRLAPGVTMDVAQRDMDRIAADLSNEYPNSNDGWGARVAPVRDWLVGDRLTRLGTLLLGVVGVFLLMACASVSNLLLARASARLEEMGVRTALGAARRRIVGQLVTEGALLALVGGGLAVALAGPALGVVRALGPNDVARLAEATVDGSVLLVATAAAVGTVLLAGLAPSLLLIRRGVFTSLRSGTRSSSRSGRRVRDGLVVAQYALTVTVLLSAGLLTRSFLELQSVDLGFDPSGVVRFAVRLPNAGFDQVAREDFLLRLGAELEAIPGVEAVGATTASPFSRWRPSNFVARSDREPDRQEDFVPVSWRAVTGDYFAAAGIPLLAGRVFGPEDRGRRGQDVANPPVVIDEGLAAELFPDGENPVGRLVTWFLPGGRQCEIVGVVASARDERMDALPRPRIYRPFTFSSWEEPSVLVRTTGDPAELVPAIRRAVSAVDPSVPTIAPAPIEDDVRASVAWPRFSMQVLVVFGLIALTLAAMGIYGVTAFSVARRRPEIGLRVALGAEPAELRWMVVRAALRLAVLGIAIGVAASFAVTGLMASILYDVSATDPATFLIVPGVLALVAIASSWLPARRALAVEPRSALVSE